MDAGGPDQAKFFSYTPDCPGLVDRHKNDADGWTGADGWGADHYSYVVANGCGHKPQDAKIGLVDGTVSPPGSAGDLDTKFQTYWSRSNGGDAVEMNLKPGAPTCDHETNFDITNTTTGGLPGLHSHHEIEMFSHSGLFQVGYALNIMVPGQNKHYWLTYALAPKRPMNTTPGVAPGVQFYARDNGDGNSLIILDAQYFGTPKIDGGWTNVDIDWNALIRYVQSKGLWKTLDINSVPNGTWVTEFFESAGYNPDGPMGAVDTYQRNWRMYYS